MAKDDSQEAEIKMDPVTGMIRIYVDGKLLQEYPVEDAVEDNEIIVEVED